MSDALSIFDSMSPSALMQDSTLTDSSARKEQFLRLDIVPETTALLPIQQIAEVLSIPIAQIIPIPHMPAWVMGVHNWRGEILWMVDLGHLCGLTPWYQQATYPSVYEVVVLQIHTGKGTFPHPKGQTLGLVVDRIDDSEWCTPGVIQSLPKSTVNSEFERFLHGFWWKSNDDMLAVLNGEAIMRAMPKQQV
ncbi:chemotaxis protein CheW [Phormidesmis sp. 146-33]